MYINVDHTHPTMSDYCLGENTVIIELSLNLWDEVENGITEESRRAQCYHEGVDVLVEDAKARPLLQEGHQSNSNQRAQADQ